ncbi:MAG TPA: hypothetical protein VKA97_07160, partial [Pyrinomonadaceae bacterium]|nr:hypothetical protein [Pyrinomonadaceae bacterium]
NTETPAKATNAAINKLRPINLYMTSISLMSGVVSLFFAFAVLNAKHHERNRCGRYLGNL